MSNNTYIASASSYKQISDVTYTKVPDFSDDTYWAGDYTTYDCVPSASAPNGEDCTPNGSVYGILPSFETDDYGEFGYIYREGNMETDNNLVDAINSYKEYLQGFVPNIIDARLMSYEEAQELTAEQRLADKQIYWLGTVRNGSNGSMCGMFNSGIISCYVESKMSDSQFDYHSMDWFNPSDPFLNGRECDDNYNRGNGITCGIEMILGIRPVIEIPRSELESKI
jgi:hypothetical protein